MSGKKEKMSTIQYLINIMLLGVLDIYRKTLLTSVGFHSGKIINVVPYTLNTGFILEVHFSPRVRVNRI